MRTLEDEAREAYRAGLARPDRRVAPASDPRPGGRPDRRWAPEWLKRARAKALPSRVEQKEYR